MRYRPPVRRRAACSAARPNSDVLYWTGVGLVPVLVVLRGGGGGGGGRRRLVVRRRPLPVGRLETHGERCVGAITGVQPLRPVGPGSRDGECSGRIRNMKNSGGITYVIEINQLLLNDGT